MHVRLESRFLSERKKNPHKPYRVLVDVFIFASPETDQVEKTVRYFLKDGVLCRGRGGNGDPESELDDISFPVVHITNTVLWVSVKGSDLRTAFAQAVEAQVIADLAGLPAAEDGGGGREDENDDGQQELADGARALLLRALMRRRMS